MHSPSYYLASSVRNYNLKYLLNLTITAVVDFFPHAILVLALKLHIPSNKILKIETIYKEFINCMNIYTMYSVLSFCDLYR